MRHVDVEVSIARDLETHHFAGVRQILIDPEAVDGAFQGLNIRRPRIAEQLMSCRDRHRTAARAGVRWDRGRPVGAVFDAMI
jgi:hypothetical protein